MMGHRIDPSWWTHWLFLVHTYIHKHMIRWVVRSILHGGPIGYFSSIHTYIKTHDSMGRHIDPSWWTHWLFLVHTYINTHDSMGRGIDQSWWTHWLFLFHTYINTQDSMGGRIDQSWWTHRAISRQLV